MTNNGFDDTSTIRDKKKKEKEIEKEKEKELLHRRCGQVIDFIINTIFHKMIYNSRHYFPPNTF